MKSAYHHAITHSDKQHSSQKISVSIKNTNFTAATEHEQKWQANTSRLHIRCCWTTKIVCHLGKSL